MWIYNFLFYKSFILSQKSKNFDDIPALGGMLFVVLCVMLNIFTIIGLIEGFGFKTGITFSKPYQFPFALALVGLLLFYYLYKGRYKKIVKHYEQRAGFITQLHPIIVVIIYFGLSILLMFLAAAFKNHQWIFE
jgi:hypothetical protein